MIYIEQAAFGYKEQLFSIQKMELEKGIVFALTGKNGAGKSTFLKTLTADISLLKGTLTLDSKDVNTLHLKERSKLIAFVGSRFAGVDYLKVYDYLALGRSPYTDIMGNLQDSDKQRIIYFAEKLGLRNFLDKYTHFLSDGERQLCAIARAFLQETPILLLDEPTAFLDFENKQIVLNHLIELAKEENKCVIFSTHDLDLCIENRLSFLCLSNSELTLHSEIENKAALLALLT